MTDNNQVVYLFILSIISAIFYYLYPNIYLIFLIIIFMLLFRSYIGLLLVIIFITIHLFGNAFFIITNIYEKKDEIILKTPSSRIILSPNCKVNIGQVIFGNFKVDKSKSRIFFKSIYNSFGKIETYNIPLITKLLQKRRDFSIDLYLKSGGKLHVVQALIFGNKEFITQDIRDKYTVSGLAHLLAMSGTHVGIIIAIFLTVLFFLPYKLRLVFSIIGVCGIVLFGAFSITVVRAATFGIAWMFASIFDLRVKLKYFLLFVASIIIFISPTSVIDVSFLLSFSAIFGIVYLLDNGINKWIALIFTGVGATLLTAPISMYIFGMTNHLSILSTIIMFPIIYLQILSGILALFIPSIFIWFAVFIENVSNILVNIIYELTYFGFILKSIPLWLLIISVVYIVITLLSPYKWLSILSLFIIFYPSPVPPNIIFPNLTGINKGFIIYNDNYTGVFFQGSYSGFNYDFLPVIAKYGIKEFDYGLIRVFGGNNHYIKVKELGINFRNVCLNYYSEECKYIYHTRANSINELDILDNVTHIIYKNNFKHSNILEIFNTGEVNIFENKGIIYGN